MQTEPKSTDVDGNSVTPNVVQHRPRLPQRHRQHQSPRRVSRHARHRPRNRHRAARRSGQLRLSPEVRLRAVQPRRLDGARLVGPLRHAADAVDRFHRYDLPLPLPGTDFEDREGILSSSDVGASFRYNFGGNYGDVHTGFYNGDNYNQRRSQRPEGLDDARDGAAAAGERGASRPARSPGFYNTDAYVKDGEQAPRHRRRRPTSTPTSMPASTTFDDRPGAGRRAPKLDGDGYSVWVTPKTPKGYGWEGLLRFDHLDAGADDLDRRRRAQPDHRRRRLLVSAPGRGVDGAALRLRATSTTTTTRRCAPTSGAGRCTC